MTIDTKSKTAEKVVPDFGPANGVKKTKTPRNYDSILKGALALELEERVKLRKELHGSIQDEVARKQKEAAMAEKIAAE